MPLTETRNPATRDIDGLPTLDMLRVISDEDLRVAIAVRDELPAIARAVDAIAERLGAGGRLIYMGAGTSGRLGVLDASEMPPTFSVPPGLVIGLIAGGDTAIRRSVEGAEDDAELGRSDLAALSPTPADALVGIAASGRTPYVIGAMRGARDLGMLVVSLACTRPALMHDLADIAIAPLVGPEVVTGSTRMKAGTATKLALNTISTTLMVRSGRVYENLMVDLRATNAKLRDRAARIVATLTGLSREGSFGLLDRAGGSVKAAVVMHRRGVEREEAERRLAGVGGRLHEALAGA